MSYTPRSRFTIRIAAVLALGPVAACAPVAPHVGVAPIARDTVLIDDLRHAPYVGTAPVVTAALYRAGGGAPEAPRDVYWTSRSIEHAWVADDGTLTVLKSGPVTIGARADGIGTVRSFVAAANPVRHVQFAARLRDGVHTGDAIRLTALAFRGDGSVVSDAQVTYAVQSRGGEPAADVAPDGVFMASVPGVYTVVAECGGFADQATVIVEDATAPAAYVAPVDAPKSPAPRPTRAGRLATVVTQARGTAKVRISDGGFEPYVNTTLTLEARVWVDGAREPDSTAMPLWSSSDSSIAWVTARGVVVFRSAGRVIITAAHGGKRASRSFWVTEHPAAHMVLNTNAADVQPGEPVKFREQVWQRGGYPVRDARVNYAIVGRGPSVRGATISDERVFVARRPGVYTIIASVGDLADRVTIVVRPSEVATR